MRPKREISPFVWAFASLGLCRLFDIVEKMSSVSTAAARAAVSKAVGAAKTKTRYFASQADVLAGSG